MVQRVYGAAISSQCLTGDIEYYICYASSPGCFLDPNPNPPDVQELSRLVNIQVTGNIRDQSQKNFEVLLMNIGLRAMPVVLSNPVAVLDLSTYTIALSGEGFVWKFAVERAGQFYNYKSTGTPGSVGLLIDDTDGLVIPSGVRLTTVANSPTGWAKNIVFEKMDTW